MPLARNGSSISTFSRPIGPCLRAISASAAISSTSSRWVVRRMVKANLAPSGRPWKIEVSGKRIRVAENDDDGMVAHEHAQVAAHQHQGRDDCRPGDQAEACGNVHKTNSNHAYRQP